MLTVRDLMSTQLFTLLESDSLYTAKQIMDMARVRHVPIVNGEGGFIGLITHRDLLALTVSILSEIEQNVQDELASTIPLREVMRTDVITLPPGAKLRQAAQLLLDHKYGCLPVVEDGKLVGIITEADFVRLTLSLMDAMEPRSQEDAAQA